MRGGRLCPNLRIGILNCIIMGFWVKNGEFEDFRIQMEQELQKAKKEGLNWNESKRKKKQKRRELRKFGICQMTNLKAELSVCEWKKNIEI